jgi:hypothetical protein
MKSAALARQTTSLKSTTPGWDDLENRIEQIEIEQERKTNRTTLRIAVAGLAVAALTGIGTLVLALVKFCHP